MAYQPAEPAAFQAYVTTANLGIAGVYQSGVLDLQGYTQVDTHIMSDQDGTITIRWYSDALGADQVRLITIPYSATSEFLLYAAPAFTPYVQYEYTNGGVAQADFFYETKFLHTSQNPQILGVTAFIAGGMVTQLNRSILVAQNDAGDWNNIKSDNLQHLKVNAANPKTSYDELPTAEMSPIAQLTWPYLINLDQVTVTEVNGGTVTQADNMAILGTSTTTASQAILASKKLLPFRAGQGVLARFAAVFTAGIADATSRQWIGVGDTDDGFFFGFDADDFAVTYRTDGAPTIVDQTAWNVDVMDGSGSASNPSGMTLDPTKGNLYQVSYGSGFGAVNFSIESDSTGDMVLVHVLEYGNTAIVPSTYNASHALHAEAHNGGSTTDIILKVAELAGFVEGDNAPTGPQNAVDDSITATTTEEPILSVRGRATFGGKTSKIDALLRFISLNNDANGAGTFRIRRDATFTGAPTFVDVGALTSVIETTALGGGANGVMTAGTGVLVWAGQVGKDKQANVDLSNLDLRIRPGEMLTVTIELVSGGGVNAAALVWREDF